MGDTKYLGFVKFAQDVRSNSPASLLVETLTDRKDKIKDHKHEPVLTCLLAGRSTGSLANQPGRSGTVDALTSKPE